MWITLFGSAIIGFLTYSLGSAPQAGEPNRLDHWLGVNTSLKFCLRSQNNNKRVLHIHHWMYLWLFLMIFKWLPLQAFCFGGMIQGLTYPDWYHVLYVEPDPEE